MTNILVKNQGLKSQHYSVNNHLASLQQSLHSFQANATSTQHNTNGTTRSSTVPPVRCPSRRANTYPTHYCWSHDGAINQNHTSATCHMRKPGHDVTATLQNTKGGSRKFLDLLPGSTT